MVGWDGFGNDIANTFISNVWRAHDTSAAERRRREDLALRARERKQELLREQRAQDLAAFTRQTERSQDRADRSTERRDASMERTLEREADERARQRARIDALPPAARLEYERTIGKPTKAVPSTAAMSRLGVTDAMMRTLDHDGKVGLDGAPAGFRESYQKSLEVAASQAAEKIAAEKAEREAEIAHRAAVLAENKRANDLAAGAAKRGAKARLYELGGLAAGEFDREEAERRAAWEAANPEALMSTDAPMSVAPAKPFTPRPDPYPHIPREDRVDPLGVKWNPNAGRSGASGFNYTDRDANNDKEMWRSMEEEAATAAPGKMDRRVRDAILRAGPVAREIIDLRRTNQDEAAAQKILNYMRTYSLKKDEALRELRMTE